MVLGMDSVGDILAKSRTLKRRVKAAKPLTPSQQKFLDAAVLIRMSPEDAEAAFMARELVQCTMPHSDPGNDTPAWLRRNGNLTLTLLPGRDAKSGMPIGYPFGVIPRLLLFWITTEAVRTKRRRLELGHSLASFMRDVGLDPNTGGGKRGDANRLKDQMRRLFKATISFHEEIREEHRAGERWLDMQVAPVGELWWDPKQPNQDTLWGSWIELGEKFHQAITAAPVPVDTRVLRALKKSPLALDLYAWATWRVFKLSKPAFIPWEGLMQQMGAEYDRSGDFVQKAKTALRKIRTVYPALNLNFVRGGMMLHPSRTAIAPAAKRA
jgi:hypothetical protein